MAMAAISHNVTGLEAPQVDDDMEISSDFGRMDEIEIDTDLGGDLLAEHDDDFMLDDVRSEGMQESHQRADAAAKDDIMLDGDIDVDGDGVMHDDDTVPDEHLTDASEMAGEDVGTGRLGGDPLQENPDIVVSGAGDDGILNEEAPVEQVQLDLATEPVPTEELDAPLDDGLDAVALNNLYTTTDVKEANATEGNELGEDLVAQDDPGDETIHHESYTIPNQEEEHGQENGETRNEASLDLGNESIQESTGKDTVRLEENNPSPSRVEAADNEQHEFAEDKPNETNPAVQDGEVHSVQGSGTEYNNESIEYHPNPLHPVVVMYRENEISLFSSPDQDASEMFFLQDESLAYGSITDLFQAFKQVLGEDIAEGEDLELSVDDLGLLITEDSTYASTTSFSQILEVYLQLHQQDGSPNPGPLYASLKTKVGFNARLNLLYQTASEGRGFSHLDIDNHSADESQYEHEDQSISNIDENATVANGGETGQSIHEDNAATVPEATDAIPSQQNVEQSYNESQNQGEILNNDTSGGIETTDKKAPAELEPAEEFRAEESRAEGQLTEADIASNGAEQVEQQPEENTHLEAGAEDSIDYEDEGEENEHAPVSYSTGSSTIQGDTAESHSGSPNEQTNESKDGIHQPEHDSADLAKQDVNSGAVLEENSNENADEPYDFQTGYEEYGEWATDGLENVEPVEENDGQDQVEEAAENGEAGDAEGEYSELHVPVHKSDFPQEHIEFDYAGEEYQEDPTVQQGGDVDATADSIYHDAPEARYNVEKDTTSLSVNVDAGEPDSTHADDGEEVPFEEGYDLVDYNEEAPPSPTHKDLQVESHNPGDSPSNKRTWAEHENDAEDESSNQDTKRIRSQ